MNNKLIVSICFYFPLISACLNLQALISKFVSTNISQFLAYFNLVLIVTGVLLFRKNIKTLSSTNQLWFIFYILYYSFGIIFT